MENTTNEIDLASALNELADRCMETTGASFYMTKKKTGMWIINFASKSQAFEDVELLPVIERATKYLMEHRKEVPNEFVTKFTLY